MGDFVEVVALAEGKTEKTFIDEIVAPYLAGNGVYLRAMMISKPGQKGGDVRFARVRNDIGLHLKQRSDTYLTTFVDYYGLKSDWPGLTDAQKQTSAAAKAAAIRVAMNNEVQRLFSNVGADRRFLPYVAMHEFEALLFSDPVQLADTLQVSVAKITAILSECGEAENINDKPQTAPSKRLEALSDRFRKTTTGIAIATAIGIPRMREQCPLFDAWIGDLESLRTL